MIPEERPYEVAFARSTASSAESTISIAATGPNVSWLANSESAGTSVSSVGLEARALGAPAGEHLRAARGRRRRPAP